MAMFDFLFGNKLKSMAQRAIYEYWISSGVINSIADNPTDYIEKGYQSNTSVYSIINRIDAMRKQAVLRLYDKDGKEVEGHELNKFLYKVNSQTNTDDFITQMLIYRLTIGEYFIYKPSITAGLNKGKVSELVMLPSGDVEIIEGTIFEPVKGYIIEGNFQAELTIDDVYHSKLFNPNWKEEKSLHGMSPLRAAANTVSKLNQIEITETKAFENQGPPYILYKESSGDPMQNRMTDPQRDEIVKKIKNAAKENNRSLPLVLKDKFGKLDLGQKLTDMAVIESSKSGIQALCNTYCMPGQIFGIGEATYNNMREARKAAWTDCLMPNLSNVSQTLTDCLINPVVEYQGMKFAFDYAEVEELQEGMEIKVNWMRGARWTGNEIREATGKNRVESPMMDEPIIPMGDGLLSDFSQNIDDSVKSFEDYLTK